jgi:hypothetical protein
MPTVATTAEKNNPTIKVVLWGISHLMIDPNTKLPNANFEI